MKWLPLKQSIRMKKLLIASTSTLHSGKYLDYLREPVSGLFQDTDEIIFIPFARPGGLSWDDYTSRAKDFFRTLGINAVGLHEFEDQKEALSKAKGIFTGGGNTFVLVSQLYRSGLMETLSQTVKSGTPYLGSSAGSNITGLSMQTTNDMPIVPVPDYRTMGAIPFNLNPHYLDPDPSGTHMGETRETRIREFHVYNSVPVLGLREGSWLKVEGEKITLEGGLQARLFRQGKEAVELESGSDLSG